MSVMDLRVVMLSWEYPPRIVGGISPHVKELSSQLARQGVEVHVVTKATPLAPDEERESSGVFVHRVHLDGEPDNFLHEIQLLNRATDLHCRRLLEEWRPEGRPTLFHAHDWLSLDAARELKYEYQLPVVATVHATEAGRNNGLHNDLQRYIHETEYWLTYEAWRVIVCSEFMRSEIAGAFNCPTDKIDVIYNGVDRSKFDFELDAARTQELRSKYARPDERIVIYVGRFVREKGIHVLLDSAGAVLAAEPKTKFLIVGGGHRERLENFVRWYGIADRVGFPGFMSSRPLHELYKLADLAVFPSLYEPFGIVALESMAAGTPVVASDAGGLAEVVLHDQTGTSSYAGSSESLTWAVLNVLEDPERASRLAERARQRLDTHFNWSSLAAQTVKVYERVWAEFLGSYWADNSLWPVTAGSEERALRLGVKEKAITGSVDRPMRQTAMPAPAERVAADVMLAEEVDAEIE